MKKKKNLGKLARVLRKNQTDAEARLWYYLANRHIEGAKFRRSQQIEHYIVDFVCFERKLVIEVDGGQHNELHNRVKDEERTRILKKKGYKVIRYWDNDVLQNTDGVLENIRQELLKGNHPHLTSPVEGEE